MEDINIVEDRLINVSNEMSYIPDLINDLHNEIENMGLSVKIHVQLLSKTNDIQIRHYMDDMATDLSHLLSKHHQRRSLGRSKEREHATNEVSKTALYSLIQEQIYDNLILENKRLFCMELQFVNHMNDILGKRLVNIMEHNSYQKIILEMKALLEQFQLGICNISRTIELQEKMEQLTYQLATTYFLNTDIKLYMDVTKKVEEYKNLFNDMFNNSLRQLDMTNFENSLRVKDLMVSKLQYYHNECYEQQKKSS